MSEKKVVDWFTSNGKHIPIYEGESKDDALNRSIALQNEDKKQADIKKNKEQAEKLNTPSKVNAKNIKILGNIDPKLSKDIMRVAQDMHSEYPEVDEISAIFTGSKSEMGLIVAQANGSLHTLQIREDIVNDYELTQNLCRDLCQVGYLAGDGTFANSTLAHEFAHNLDQSMFRVAMYHAPQTADKPIQIKNEGWAYIYSKSLGREIKVGDTIDDIPTADFDKPFFTLDGKSYSLHSMDDTALSDVVVPVAIENILKNWKELGYPKQPTEAQLVKQLSGYVDKWYTPSDKHYKAEIFAESYSNYKSYGVHGNPLAQEVMRLTNQAYASITNAKKNDMSDFYEKFAKARTEMLEKKKRGEL